MKIYDIHLAVLFGTLISFAGSGMADIPTKAEGGYNGKREFIEMARHDRQLINEELLDGTETLVID